MRRRKSLWSAARGQILGAQWPPVLAGPAASLGALVSFYEYLEWCSPEEIAEAQESQLAIVTHHAREHSPFMRNRITPAHTFEALRRLPLLTRRDIQAAGKTLFTQSMPPGHTPVGETQTSGSTDEPVVVLRTAINQLHWLANTVREHIWHETDFMGRLSAVRAQVSTPRESDHWGQAVSTLFDTGPAQALPITMDVAELAKAVIAFQPSLLLIYPNMLEGLANHCAQHGLEIPSLKQIRSIGETLHRHVRENAQRVFGASVIDNYSSQELGIIAVQCPDSPLYHVMAESVFVEILDAQGRPCKEGELGRVVVTDLHNFSTPLIRYDIGDYAEPGPTCPCGRGLPTLKRIAGRERNLILMPDGTRHWPLVGFSQFRKVAPVVQYQMIQDGRRSVEVRLVCSPHPTPEQEASLREVIQSALGFPFDLRFTYFADRIPPGPNGKFDEFVCKVVGEDT